MWHFKACQILNVKSVSVEKCTYVFACSMGLHMQIQVLLDNEIAVRNYFNLYFVKCMPY